MTTTATRPLEVHHPMTTTRAILITGAGGEIGHGLIHALSEHTRTPIVALDKNAIDPALAKRCAASIEADITDDKAVAQLGEKYDFDAIFHLAALLSSTSERVPDLALRVNVLGTAHLLKLAGDTGVRTGRATRFLFPSSIAVYGMPDAAAKERAGKIREDQFNTPATMYGCNKLACEHLGRYFSERDARMQHQPQRVDFRAIRFPGIISADTLPSGGTSDFAPEMIHAAAKKQPYSCFVREDTRIPFMTMPDAVRALLALDSAPQSSLTTRVYNIGAFAPSAGEVRDIVRKEFPGANITFEVNPARQAIVDSWPADLDDTLARRDWNYTPRHDLRAAFDDYLIPAIRARYA
ncbi:MAG: NAD-dependent epimerase/dehydratase family protein [Phycisphaeraceae bacterium]|nr:NAD-dependent epimerase/dehydratase family protein [Phycisphaeraceae bacterium]